MRLWWISAAAMAALWAAPAAAGTSPEPREVRKEVMWHRADRLWSGALPALGCGPRLPEPTGDLALAAPLRRATFERRGEVIAELRAPRWMTRSVLSRGRDCAARAAETATVPALLTPAPEPFEVFHGELAACLQRTGAARHLGSMTLWIDTSCNW